MNADTWRAVTDLAATQHGLLSTAQLSKLGASPSAIAHARRTGRLVTVRRGVFEVSGTPPSVWRPLCAALLTVDGLASHRAAAGLHRLPGVLPGAVELTVFGLTAPRLEGVVTHRAYALVADDLAHAEGLPVTSPARTLIDMASRGDVDTSLLTRMVDDCAVRRLCSAEDVDACLVRADARRGTRRLRRLIEERVRTDSHLTQVWLRRLVRAGLRPPEVGYQLAIDRSVLVLDFAWPRHRIGVEVDGWRPHSPRGAFDRDRLRDLAAVRARWTMLRVTSRTPPAQLFTTLRSLMTQ